MKLSLSRAGLSNYVSSQLNNYIPDGDTISAKHIDDYLPQALERIEYCFSRVNSKYYFDEDGAVFNHLNTDHYAMFLYILSNVVYRAEGNLNLCSKLFVLNKTLHGIDAFYEVSLPDIFLFVHPMATVLGRGTYSDYLIIYQRCGVGSNHGIYPVLGEHLTLHPGAVVLGNCLVENNCKIAAGSLVIDRNLEKNTVYIGNPKSFELIKKPEIHPFWKK